MGSTSIRTWVQFLVLEVFAIGWAGLSFTLIADRFTAGLVAGAYFVLSAGWMLRRITRRTAWWRTATLYPLLTHLFGISVPLLITRVLHRDQPFEQVHIWGLDGPTFHRLSTQVFSVLIAATVIDLVRAMWTRERGPT